MQVYENTCAICGKPIMDEDSYFKIADFAKPNFTAPYAICEECAKSTSVYDLYYCGKITMLNSPDNVIEVDATVDEIYEELNPEN